MATLRVVAAELAASPCMSTQNTMTAAHRSSVPANDVVRRKYGVPICMHDRTQLEFANMLHWSLVCSKTCSVSVSAVKMSCRGASDWLDLAEP